MLNTSRNTSQNECLSQARQIVNIAECSYKPHIACMYVWFFKEQES